MKQAYLHFGVNGEPRQTIAVESRDKALWFHERGLSETKSGYGLQLTSPMQIKWEGRWRRVYICCVSNLGTAYIGKPGRWIATVSTEEI